MMRIEAASERAERGQDHLGSRDHKTATGDAAALQVEPELRVIVAGHFRSWIVPDRFVAKDDSADLDLLDQPAAAMVRKAGIVVAHDPRPVETLREVAEELAGACRKPVASEAVVEAVAEAEEAGRTGALNNRCK